MSLWEFHAAIAGYVKANTVQKLEPPSPTEFHELLRKRDETVH